MRYIVWFICSYFTFAVVKYAVSVGYFSELTLPQQGPVHVAAIELEQVHAPVGKRLSVGLVVSQTSRVSGTGFLPHICVDSQLQPL